MTIRTAAPILAATLALAACQGSGTADVAAPSASSAVAVADALRGTGGVGAVTVTDGTVIATIDAAIPAAGLDAAAGARIGEAARGTFTADTCRAAGLDAFFAAGGVLRLDVVGSDGGAIAQVPITSCV